jgi:hypothetical protein
MSKNHVGQTKILNKYELQLIFNRELLNNKNVKISISEKKEKAKTNQNTLFE